MRKIAVPDEGAESLFGNYDENLKHLEGLFAVRIRTSGQELIVEGEAADVKSRLQELQKQGAQKVVLDLRSVAGGALEEGVKVANLFIKEGTLAQTVGRGNSFTASAGSCGFGALVTYCDSYTSAIGVRPAPYSR